MYKNDMASMQSSIEARVPLVDVEVFKAVAKIEDRFRFSPEYSNKKILKEILKKYLPKELVERPKKGFGFSFDKIGTNFLLADYESAAKFHLDNAEIFAVNGDLIKLLSQSKSEIICKKFPRFAFSLITNYLAMRGL
jgi:asparagine synthetase B (glutamine-hydrolysing)